MKAMKMSTALTAVIVIGVSLVGVSSSFAQPAATPSSSAAQIPADPWPRDVSVSNAAVLIYQPQVNKWEGNQIDFRAALSIKPTGAKEEDFGVVFATARTQVDKVTRMVVFENLKITKADFPTLPDHGAQYAEELQKSMEADVRTISLDRLESSLALAGVKLPTVDVQNDPPQVLVSYSAAILVPIDGSPVLQPAPESSRFQRVINTKALILQGGSGDKYYIHVYDGWLSAETIDGPWALASMRRSERDDANAIARKLSKNGTVDLLDGGPKADPKPALANGAPTIY